jgi:predicted RND superfamily exporter protein
MSVRLARAIWRARYPACAVILLGFFALAPLTNFTDLDNDISAWISKDDPVYQTYERFRDEFGGGRALIVALRSDRLFEAQSLRVIRDVTEEIKRIDRVQRVQSLSTANVVRAVPAADAEEAGGIEVQPLLEDLDAPDAAGQVRRTALEDDLLRGDLVSEDGTVTAIVVTFDEDRIDEVRGQVIDRIHHAVDTRLPRGMEAFYNGSLEISEAYNRITLDNTKQLTPPILLLTILAVYVMFRSWRVTGLVVISILVSTVWTMGLFALMGFKYNVLASMLPPLVIVLAIADDVHIVQHFVHDLRETRDRKHAFISSVEHLFTPLLGASATTALGLLSLATSNVHSVRTFGIGAATGVMVDFVMSLVFVPTLLTLVNIDTAPPPQERWLVGPMRAVARFSVGRARPVLVCALVAAVVATAGISRLRVDTNHINFFSERHSLHRSADVIDRYLSGIYSFNILLEGPPDSMKTPDALRRMERLREQLQQLPFVRKVISLADYVKRVNRELHGGAREAAVVPASAEAIAQELFVFGLSDDGRVELERMVASDYSRAQMSVKLASMSSDLVFEQINEAEKLAAAAFAGSDITVTATGSGRIFATLDHYLVVSQLSSFATAFVTVFAVIFIVFRSARFGLLGVIANAVPVFAVLGLMGWMDISLNVATVMVASVALGIVDDDTIHFINRYRRETALGVSSADAIELATVHEGRASLTTAIVNSLGFGVMVFSEYRPTAWFGGLLALTMAVAFIAEVFIVPAVITMLPKIYGVSRSAGRLGTAA